MAGQYVGTEAGRGPWVRLGAGQGAGAETGTVQGCSRFVNLSIERLDHFSSHIARLREIGEVALCTNTCPSTEPACCSLLGVHNPIGVWCNPVIEIMSGDY